MIYVVDIDGTICTAAKNNDYKNCDPLVDRIKKINELYDEGNTVIYQTARGMGRHSNNPLLAIQEFYKMTVEQLESWGVRYHQLVLGKPAGDVYIDDKGINDTIFFEQGQK